MSLQTSQLAALAILSQVDIRESSLVGLSRRLLRLGMFSYLKLAAAVRSLSVVGLPVRDDEAWVVTEPGGGEDRGDIVEGLQGQVAATPLCIVDSLSKVLVGTS